MAEDNFTPISLDANLDDIDTLPGFVTPPSGAYIVTLHKGLEEKKIGEHPALEASLSINQVVELSEQLGAGEEAPKEGDMFSLAFMLDNKIGAGMLKDFVKPLGEKLGTSNLRQIAEGCKGMQILVVVSRTFDKEKQRHYIKHKRVAII